MADLRIYPSQLCGEVLAPPSKSAAHRALICASLADGVSHIFPLSASHDMQATIDVLCAMGAHISVSGDGANVRGAAPSFGKKVLLNCKESGSTLRFLLPVAAAFGLNATFCGEGRLPARPIGVLAAQLSAHGVQFSSECMPFTISGQLVSGRFELPGNVSSQFISGLLFALPLVAGDSEIVLTTPLESAGYVEMTLSALAQSGISIETTVSGYKIRGNQCYRAADRIVEADYSNAAFWLCAGAIGGDICVRGLETDSAQGDRAIVALIQCFGGNITAQNGVIVSKKSHLIGCRIDAAPIPDLVPIIAVMAAFANGDTEIYNAVRLRIKESDRLATVSALLRGLGGHVDEYADRLVIHGGRLIGGVADGTNDHRIVMSAAIAAAFCEQPVSVIGAHAVEKSYPNFFDDFEQVGGRFYVELG